MRGWKLWTVLSVLAVLLALVIASRYSEWESRQRAERWLQQARQDASASMTKEDAIDWLRRNGADLIAVGVEKRTNGVEREPHEVWGFRTVRQKDFWLGRRKAQLVFEFDDNWQFQGVRMEISDF